MFKKKKKCCFAAVFFTHDARMESRETAGIVGVYFCTVRLHAVGFRFRRFLRRIQHFRLHVGGGDSAEHKNAARDLAVRPPFVRYATREHRLGQSERRHKSLGETWSDRLLRRAVLRTLRSGNRFCSPHAHASVEQHIPLDGQSSYLHAAPVSLSRNPETLQETPQLFVGAQSFGTEVSFCFIYVNVKQSKALSYPMASSEELADNSDNCAICWEKMESARKLPCTHLFHK